MRPLLILPSLVTGTMIFANQSAAATVNFAGFNGGNDLTVVEADEFDTAGSAGNTVFADAGNTGGGFNVPTFIAGAPRFFGGGVTVRF